MRLRMIATVSALSVTLATVMACSDSLHLGAEATSPSGRYVASFFGISGGGAGGWASQFVGIRLADRSFDRNDHVLQITHGYEVCLVWESDTRLVVEYPDEAMILSFEQAPVVDQRLAVEYRSRPSIGGKFRERTCAGCLAQIGAAGLRWSSCAESVLPKQLVHETVARGRR